LVRENYTEVRRRKRICPFLFKVNVANKASPCHPKCIKKRS